MSGKPEVKDEEGNKLRDFVLDAGKKASKVRDTAAEFTEGVSKVEQKTTSIGPVAEALPSGSDKSSVKNHISEIRSKSEGLDSANEILKQNCASLAARWNELVNKIKTMKQPFSSSDIQEILNTLKELQEKCHVSQNSSIPLQDKLNAAVEHCSEAQMISSRAADTARKEEGNVKLVGGVTTGVLVTAAIMTGVAAGAVKTAVTAKAFGCTAGGLGAAAIVSGGGTYLLSAHYSGIADSFNQLKNSFNALHQDLSKLRSQLTKLQHETTELRERLHAGEILQSEFLETKRELATVKAEALENKKKLEDALKKIAEMEGKNSPQT